MMTKLFMRRLNGLLTTTAIVALPMMLGAETSSNPCEVDAGGCDGDITVSMPVGANTELSNDVPDLADDGFDISVDGEAVAQDGTIIPGPPKRASVKRRQDVALAKAEVQIKFDGLDVRPSLALGVVGSQNVQPGQTVRFANRMNYPAFVARGELLTIEVDARGHSRIVKTQALPPNSEVVVNAPAAGVIRYYSYRVYDKRGRYDETQPVSLNDLVGRGVPVISDQNGDLVEEGIDTTVTSRIPVYGGAVTVSGTNVGGGRVVNTLGERVRADNQGRFVLQRILPSGDHLVDVDVTGGERLARELTIPNHDLFYAGIVDVTVHHSLENELEDATGEDYDKTVTKGRIAFYLKGKIKGNALLTASMDTDEEDLDNLFSNLDEKNPRSLLDRIDPDEYYPVYGDDSTSVNNAPTSGKFYVRLEKNASHVMWGTFKSEIGGTEYLHNERTLYGAQGVYRSLQQTGTGESRVEAQIFAAQPETLPQRDVFLGTGGSVYFLRFQDISRGSETVQVEIQDPKTGRVVSRRTLVYGIDYDINYVQGLVTLRTPLAGTAVDGDTIVNNPSGDNKAYLVTTYEHTPTISDVGSFSYGGRVQVWADDHWRFGATAQHEDLGSSDQTAYGADILYHHSDRTFFEFEYARTDGAGLDQSTSIDGGLTGGIQAGISGAGSAYKVEFQADLEEIGLGMPGLVGGYFEDRSAGFSTLSYRSVNDETLYGFFLETDPSERWSLRFDYDHFEDSAGRSTSEGSAAATYYLSDRVGLTFGAEHLEDLRPGSTGATGRRTDVALRVDVKQNDSFRWYAYAQGTAEVSGELKRNNRLGLGAEYAFNENWTGLLEVSDGSTGVGAQARVSYANEAGNTSYFGYTLDPGRELEDQVLTGRDKGRFVVGAARKINDRLNFTGENSYDLFGARKSLTSAYGANYGATERLTFSGAFEVGQVDDTVSDTNFDRKALSLGATYDDETLTWRGRIELRRDEGRTSGNDQSADTIAASFSTRYKISDNARLLFAVEGISSKNATESIPEAEYAELTLGYAFRPVESDRFNILAKYQHIYDMTERSGFTAPSDGNFLDTPRQRAHIFSIDASYDLNEKWTLGGKIGGRLSDQDNGNGFVSNDAALGVLNLRYHAVHKWDFLLEARQLNAEDVGSSFGVLGAAYRHLGNNLKIGIGYNAGSFSDDLADVTYDDKGVFLNIVGKF